jgi:hypothetical protein
MRKIKSSTIRLTAFSKVDNLRINYAMKRVKCVYFSFEKMGSGFEYRFYSEKSFTGLHAASSEQILPNGVSLEEIERG